MPNPAVRSFPKNMTADAKYVVDKCESLGSGKQRIVHGNPFAIASYFFTAYVSSSTSFLPNMQFACCKILQDTLRDNFDIFAANGEATASVLLWKTRSRPIGMNVCPVAQFNFYSTAFDPPAWTLVVFWKENLGRQLQLITPENEGGDNTNYPSAPTSTFLDDPEVPCCPQGTQPPAPPEPQEPPGQPGQPGIPPGWPPAPSRACGGMSGNRKYIA